MKGFHSRRDYDGGPKVYITSRLGILGAELMNILEGHTRNWPRWEGTGPKRGKEGVSRKLRNDPDPACPRERALGIM